MIKNILQKIKSSLKNEPIYRGLRNRGDDLFKQNNFEEAYELFVKSYKYSIKEADNSLTILMRIIKVANKLDKQQLVEKWIKEFDNLKKSEGNLEYALFGKVKILISINRISDAIVELNKMNPDKMSYYDFHLKHKYYQICYKKLKLIKTQLHHCIIKRLYLLAHHNDLNNFFRESRESFNQSYKAFTGKERKQSATEDKKDEYRGSIFLTDDQDKEIINLFKRGKFTNSYNQFKEDIDNILIKESNFVDKIENMDAKEFHEYFKLIN